jgi:hypothetical protein
VKACLAPIIATLAASAATAQTPTMLDFEGERWRIDAEHAQIFEFLGAEALHFRDGLIWLDDHQLDTGEIRFDLAISGAPGHTGVVWRSQGEGDWEKFYFRHHLSGMPDSVQYTPGFDGVTGWQIYSDGDAMSAVDHGLDRWMSVRVVIAEDQADIYHDGALVHHIPDLLRDRAEGGIGFWQLAPNDQASAYVRNVEVVRADNPVIIGERTVTHERPEGLVEQWRVSEPFDAQRLENETLAAIQSQVRSWTRLDVEPNGIANLARAARISEGNTVLAEITLTAQTAQTLDVSFGYSDRVVVALNGERLFAGDNGWASRDYRYLGTVTRHLGVPLTLEAGENTLTFAVSESFGGWAVTADIETAPDVTVAAD